MTIIIFFAVLFVLILVHEWGHFIVAKKNDIRVDEFGIGFPPRLFGIKKGETEYTFNLLPIGGFVRIYGENVEDATADAAEGADISNSFIAKKKSVQAAVLLAGITMNILFAWFLFSLVFAIGVPTVVDESDATSNAELVISNVIPDGPAAKGHIPVGAKIISLTAGDDNDSILYPSSFSAFTEDHLGVAMDIVYQLKGEQKKVTITPEKNVLNQQSDKPAIGVSLALVENIRKPIYLAVYDGFFATIKGLRDISLGLGSLLVNSIRGTADFSQIAGPIGIVSLVGEAANFGITSLLMFTAFISLNLAVINLLPFPALDGGRLLFVAIEALTGRPMNPKWVARMNLAGFSLLILLMILVTYSDITKLL